MTEKYKITKIWRGKTKAKHADEYLQYIMQTGLKEYRQLKGNLSAKVLRRIEDDFNLLKLDGRAEHIGTPKIEK